jgi:hypothetical protein
VAPPTYRNSGSYVTGVANTIGVSVPAGAADDIIVASLYIENIDDLTTIPSGFAEAPDSPSPTGLPGTVRLHVLWKRATGADDDGGTYTFGWTNSTYRVGSASRYPGAIATGSPWDDTASSGTASSNASPPAVGLTTTGPDRLLIYTATSFNSTAWTAPSGFTKRVDQGSNDVMTSDGPQVSAGTVSLQGSAATTTHAAWAGALIPPPPNTHPIGQAVETSSAQPVTANPVVVTSRSVGKLFPSGAPSSSPVTTGSFTPAAGELLLATVIGFEVNGTQDLSQDFTVTDSQGLTWSPVVNLDNPAAWALGARTWISSPAAASAMTVTFGFGSRSFWDHDYAILGVAGATGQVAGLVVDEDAPTDGAYTVDVGEAPAAADAVIYGRSIDNDGDAQIDMGADWSTAWWGALAVSWRTGSTSPTVTIDDTNTTPNGLYKAIDWAFALKAGAYLPRVNLCTNPHADVDVSGWTRAGDPLVRAAAATGFPKATAVECTNTTGVVTTAPGAVTAGQVYTLSARVKNISALGDTNPFVEWRDSGGAVLSYSAGPSTPIPVNIPTLVAASGTAPAGAAAAALLMGNAFGARQFGAVLIEPGGYARSYGDGDTDGWHWDGTPGLSASAEGPPTTVLVDVGQATSVELAQPITPAKLVAVAAAVELGTARTVGRSKATIMAAAVELSEAAAMVGRHVVRVDVGQAVEDALAAAWARTKLRSLGRAVEVERAADFRSAGEPIPPTVLTATNRPTATLAAGHGGARLEARHG